MKHLWDSQRHAQHFVSYVIPKADNENGQSQRLNKFVQTMQAAKCSQGSAPACALWRQATSVALLVHPNSCLLGLNKAKLKPPSRKKKKEEKKPSLQTEFHFLIGGRFHPSKTLVFLYHKWDRCSLQGSYSLVGTVILI